MTAIVVTLNESARLRDCLTSLRFCDEIIVVDLGSEDDCVAIAESCGAQVFTREPTPVVEIIREEMHQRSRNDWLIFLDPDEVFPPGVEDELSAFIDGHPTAGLILFPWRFYFKGEPLTTTVWGFIRHKQAIVHRHRVRFSGAVHRGSQLREGFDLATFTPSGGDFITHYWMDSYRGLMEKHWRYIRHEGASRFQQGERFSWRRWAKETSMSLKQNLIDCRGLSGGIRGILLSFFHCWYTSMSLLSLKIYESRSTSQRPNV